jgi:ribosomal-protein-alanine N-acetyltransferase
VTQPEPEGASASPRGLPRGPRTQLGLEIRDAGWRDFRPIMALEKLCFGRDSWPWVEILAALSISNTVRLKAERGLQIVGFVIGDRRAREDLGWVASIGVHPAYRRQGIGRRLLAECEDRLGTSRVRLSLRRSNEEALALYRTVGYAEVTVWPKYYNDGEDALVMERVLSA